MYKRILFFLSVLLYVFVQVGPPALCVPRWSRWPFFDDQAEIGRAFLTLGELGVVHVFGVGIIVEECV